MRRFVLPAFLLLASASLFAAATLPELFQKAKEQARLGSFPAALNTLEKVEGLSQQTGLEKDRAALIPALAFYRGVCYAGLNRPEEARREFAAFLEANPNAALDPGAYPRKVIAVFEETRKSFQGPDVAGSSATGTIAEAYRAFRKPESVAQEDVGENWAEGPVRFLLTASEQQEYRHDAGSVSRSEFVEKFWRSRDPKVETPENEFRDEFERRAAFADQWFVQGETRGSYTDRGMVFVLLGPPTHDGSRPMKTGEDSADPAALFRFTRADVQVASQPGGSRAARVARIDAVTGPGTSVNAATPNWREVWRFERKDLPARVPYSWVDFHFISKHGYGEAVLQRDPAALQTLDRAKARLPKP